MKKLQKILNKLFELGISPEYSDPHFDLSIDWQNLPNGIDPMYGFLKPDRAKRKRWQIENFVYLAKKYLNGHKTIVDFCSGSGHLSIPMAYIFQDCYFLLVEKNPIPVEIGIKRIRESGLKNIEIFNENIQDFHEKFDLGIALHACGEATDLAQKKCIENDAPYILCPCDIGYIQNSQLKYPRSQFFSEFLSYDEYKTIASAADMTGWDFNSPQSILGKICMGYISLDRNLFAEENDYKTYLFTTCPREATPKNDIISGHTKGYEEIRIYDKLKYDLQLIIKTYFNNSV